MLQNIRNNSQGLLAKIFVGFIVFVFAIFGLDSIVGTIGNTNSTVSVNGVAIDELAIESEAQRITQELLSSLGAQIDLSTIDTTQFREQAINNLVERELLIQTAFENGMLISAATLDREIAQTTDFQVDGVFSNERAQALLASFGYTPATYRASLQQQGLLNQMFTVYSVSSFATPNELENLARINEEKRNFRYIRVDANNLSVTQVVSDDEISQYYDANSALFMQGERVSLEYLELNKNDLLAEIEVTDDQIQAQYDIELSTLQAQTERRASHILLQAAANEVEEVIGQAELIKSRIDAGESFEDLAAEFSVDNGSAQYGGDVGYTTGETFAEEFESALEGLELDEVSGPIRTQFGIHLIKLTEITEDEAPSIEESRDRIQRELQDQAVEDIYIAKAEELNNLSFESIDLQEPADILDLTIQTTDLFDNAGGLGIAAESGVISAAFSSDVQEGLNSELIALDDSRSVVIRMLELREPELRSMIEASAEVESTLRMQKAEEQALSLGETFLSNLNNDQNIDNLLAVQGLEWSGGQNLSRTSSGLDPEILQMIFDISKPDESSVLLGQQLASGDYVIAELLEVIPGDLDEMSEDNQLALQSYLMQLGATSDFSAYMSGVHTKADIER
ncbi:MAG: SurA N-terminal domain-containing protein [Gammaproteobacteria bacterium]|nr:SurA N-terminal domain-containing protein [Gammaproteobacteria bacterium]